jgi:hypothetical protein
VDVIRLDVAGLALDYELEILGNIRLGSVGRSRDCPKKYITCSTNFSLASMASFASRSASQALRASRRASAAVARAALKPQAASYSILARTASAKVPLAPAFQVRAGFAQNRTTKLMCT